MERKGLSSTQVKQSQQEHGLNVLPEKKKRPIWLVFLDQFKSPLIYLLFIAAIITFFFGKKSDPFVVLFVVFLNALIGTFHEAKAAKSIEGLKKLAGGIARVLRDGKEVEIPVADVAVGDWVILAAGDKVPADSIIQSSRGALFNESMLTGESEAVSKGEGDHIFSGSFLLAGRVEAVVALVGAQTELGKIAEATSRVKTQKTPLELKVDRLGRRMAYGAVALFFAVLGIGALRGMPLQELLLAAVAQVVSMIPEGLPIAITISLATGVQRLSKNRAVIRKLPAVETLGSTSVICTDKTGTLTQNRMEVVDYFYIGRLDKRKKLLEVAALCTNATAEAGDPTEIAIIQAYQREGGNVEKLKKEHPRTEEIPFDSIHQLMATEHADFIAMKGSVEALLPLCENDGNARDYQINAVVLAEKGLRVLGVAQFEGASLPKKGLPQNGKFLGLIALEDPLRKEVKNAVETCHQAGIKTVMVTGDQIKTGEHIARQSTIFRDGDDSMNGDILETLSEEELANQIDKIRLFARVKPHQKMKIVHAFQKKGEIVAMTGDGVNDAPALAHANVGVAMGKGGSDVAKSAADMIITDDNFATIVKATEIGRIIYNNLKKLVFYLLSTSLPAVLMMLFAVLFGYPLPLAAVQILWINIVTEGSVTINLIMDPPEGGEMELPPRREDRILTKPTLYRMAYLIGVIFATLLGYFLWESNNISSLRVRQTEMFTLLAMCAWINVFNCRWEKRSAFALSSNGTNWFLVIGLILGISLHMAVLYIPFLADLFQTVPLEFKTLLKLFLLSLIVLIAEEVRKCFVRRLKK